MKLRVMCGIAHSPLISTASWSSATCICTETVDNKIIRNTAIVRGSAHWPPRSA
jgi:hypothetical protein